MPTEYQRYRVLWPLVPAMAMVMIDFTIVSISASTIQSDLGLSETAVQWLVTAYALSTAAFVALGGRLGDILGHRRIVIIGVILFAGASLMCGLVPEGSIDVPWLIFFRVLQGVGGGLLIPSATVLVLDAFPPDERGKGLSVFFIVAGLFTAIGPVAGSYLTEYWTWRAIFWINVPVALLSLFEFRFAKLNDVKRPAKLDVRGAVLIVVGMAPDRARHPAVDRMGLGQPGDDRSRSSPASIVLGAFVSVERKTEDPLIDVNAMIANRPFAVDNLLTFLVFAPWLAVFFFGSVYFQVAVGQEPTQAGFSILTMFYSFFVASRIGGGWMDKRRRQETGRDRLPARRDRDDRLGRQPLRTEPERDPLGDADHRRRLRPRLLAAQHRRPQPRPRRDARPGLRRHPDLPQLRLGDRDGDHGLDRRLAPPT